MKQYSPVILFLFIIATTLVGCGINGQGVINGKWVDTPHGQVWCLGTDSGGLECDWDQMKRES